MLSVLASLFLASGVLVHQASQVEAIAKEASLSSVDEAPAPAVILPQDLEDWDPETAPALNEPGTVKVDTPTAAPSPTRRALATPAPVKRTPASKPTVVSQTVTIGPDRIVIPAISVDARVIPVGWQSVVRGGQVVVEWETAAYAAGFHKDSALPGQVGNTVISGHNNIKGAVFRKLYTLKPGDEVILFDDGREYRYRVERTLILKDKGEPLEVRVRNAQWIAPTSDVRLTLVSCWPETSNTHRVVVVARPLAP